MTTTTQPPPPAAPPVAAPSVIGRNKSVGWYVPTLENITEAQRDLLENYSHIPPERVIPHILEVREKAWEIFPYPCIGQFQFIDPCLPRSPLYPTILARLHDGASLLDLGCCFAQDIRKLVQDGAPSSNLYGIEIVPEFISLGYDLFLDKDTLGAHFSQGDVFEEKGALVDLKGKIDIIQVGLFLHLFDLERQIKACKILVRTLKPKKGVLITGQQVGSVEPLELSLGNGSKIYKHNEESFAKMWKEVGDSTGTEWKVNVRLGDGLSIGQTQSKWADPSTVRLVFELERTK